MESGQDTALRATFRMAMPPEWRSGCSEGIGLDPWGWVFLANTMCFFSRVAPLFLCWGQTLKRNRGRLPCQRFRHACFQTWPFPAIFAVTVEMSEIGNVMHEKKKKPSMRLVSVKVERRRQVKT